MPDLDPFFLSLRFAATATLGIVAVGVIVPALNLAVPAASPFHLSTYVVTVGGKYLTYALLALAVFWVVIKKTWVGLALRAAAQNRVAVVPVATIEDHGLHLPIDTDVRLCYAACDRAVALIPDKAVLIPPINHGYSPHHMDFPGPITIGWDTFIRYMLDVCKSLVAHGFRRILIVNGHGSNTPFVDIISRLTVVETGALAAAIN